MPIEFLFFFKSDFHKIPSQIASNAFFDMNVVSVFTSNDELATSMHGVDLRHR